MAAEAAISTLLELLGEQLIQKVKSLQGVEGKVELLQVELKAMQSFLNDANKKQYEDERVRNWISDIRELAQDAEDTIEMFIINVENARNMSLFDKCTHLDTIGEEIESIREKLSSINERRITYGIKDLDEAAESGERLEVESRRRLLPGQRDEHLVGVEDDVKKLLQESILCEEKKGLSIAVLEGMGGIGKSTLAREIYNHPDVVAGRFDCRAWVVVSSELTEEETIKQLILELPRSEEEKEEMKVLEESKDKLYRLRKLKEMLGQKLKGKSYFIVLDDVWKKEHLESLITDFPNQQEKACRILVTTRSKDVAKYGQYVHEMKLLDFEKGWVLLLKKVFNGSNSSGDKCPEEWETVGRQIVEKCHGLPLVISIVGGLLVKTQTKSEWEQVLNQINYQDMGVSSILELSYQNLSSQLKSCFLWLAFFREDSTIPAKRLLSIWDAQGLIKQEGSRSIDQIGRSYLNELINRSMVQIQDHVDGRVTNCRIHDLVREVCLRKAKEEIGLEIVKQGEKGNVSSKSSPKPRHLVVYGENFETFSSNHNKHLRSLFLLKVKVTMTTPSNYWRSYQLLKTLELDGFAFGRFPNSFRLLIGLKCLRIHKSRKFRYAILELPSWLDHLKNLEVLDIGWRYVKFPTQVSLKMERLHFFHAYKIGHGVKDTNIWQNIECLKHVSHVDWMRCGSTLTSGCRLSELGIHFLDEQIEREELMKLRVSLEKLQDLAILHLMWIPSLSADVALAMPRELTNLTKLKLRGELSKSPCATAFPPNLSHLTLEGSYLHDEDLMAELGKLPKLSFLKIQRYAYWGQTMKVSCNGFPCLKALTLGEMEELSRHR